MQHWDCLQNERKQHPNTQQKHQRTHFDLYTVPEILDQRQSMHLRKKKKEIKKKEKKRKNKAPQYSPKDFLHSLRSGYPLSSVLYGRATGIGNLAINPGIGTRKSGAPSPQKKGDNKSWCRSNSFFLSVQK